MKAVSSTNTLESYFSKYRKNIIGIEQEFVSPFGNKKIIYADWIASGRMYGPIEDIMRDKISPYVGNTHTETTVTGCTMTHAYHLAKDIIKRHVNASETDILISSNSGMTGVVNKFQRILGLRVHENHRKQLNISEEDRPIVFVTHMEHHSNQTSWIETIADVEVMDPCPEGKVDVNCLDGLLEKYKNRKIKIAAVTSCSNVTGVFSPYAEIAKKMHAVGGYCFADFACSAPYIEIDMHPKDKDAYLDAIYFSPHKFLGGPSTTGILIFNHKLYNNKIPDNPGGGTVDWTNPWGEHKYHDEIEAREDGGTPAFLQTIRVALCVQLKEEMGIENIIAREHELIDIAWPRLKSIPNLHILAGDIKDRLGVISFYIDDLHYNLAVQILNDRYGIQVRGGCSCAGTYGHYLLNVSKEFSKDITDKINAGDYTHKPGWVRLSLHPTMTNDELQYILGGIEALAANYKDWVKDYQYDPNCNEYKFKSHDYCEMELVQQWFNQAMS